MFYRRCIVGLFLAVAFVLAPTASAQVGTHFRDYDASHLLVIGAKAAPLQGIVLGTDGRPVSGAEVRIERENKSSAPITTVTGSNGQYLFAQLPAGLYKMSIVAGGAVKFSADIRMVGKKARTDFDFRASAGKTMRNYAWAPGRSGSNGSWVEASDTGSVKRPKVELLPGDIQTLNPGSSGR